MGAAARFLEDGAACLGAAGAAGLAAAWRADPLSPGLGPFFQKKNYGVEAEQGREGKLEKKTRYFFLHFSAANNSLI